MTVVEGTTKKETALHSGCTATDVEERTTSWQPAGQGIRKAGDEATEVEAEAHTVEVAMAIRKLTEVDRRRRRKRKKKKEKKKVIWVEVNGTKVPKRVNMVETYKDVTDINEWDYDSNRVLTVSNLEKGTLKESTTNDAEFQTKVPWTTDSGVQKTLLAEKHFG